MTQRNYKMYYVTLVYAKKPTNEIAASTFWVWEVDGFKAITSVKNQRDVEPDEILFENVICKDDFDEAYENQINQEAALPGGN